MSAPRRCRTAAAAFSRRLGVWPGVAADGDPHRQDSRLGPGPLRICAHRCGGAGPARRLGYVVPNRALGAALWSQLGASRGSCACICPAQVARIVAGEQSVELSVIGAPAARVASISAQSGGRGGRHRVRGARRVRRRRPRCATTSRRRSSPPCCRESFTSMWPTSASPQRVRSHCCRSPTAAARWCLTLSRALAESAMSWSDEEFLAEVQRRFGFRLGRFLKVGRRVRLSPCR